MATDMIDVRIRIKHLWLLKAINVLLLLLGFGPYIPAFCIGTEIV